MPFSIRLSLEYEAAKTAGGEAELAPQSYADWPVQPERNIRADPHAALGPATARSGGVYRIRNVCVPGADTKLRKNISQNLQK